MTVKTTTFVLLALLTGLGLQAQMPPSLRPGFQRPGVMPINPAASAATNRSAVPPMFSPSPGAPVAG